MGPSYKLLKASLLKKIPNVLNFGVKFNKVAFMIMKP